MSEERPASEPSDPGKGEDDLERRAQPDDDTTDWKSEARKWQARAKANQDASVRLQEIEDGQKSETERLTSALQKAESRAAESELAALRLKVALKAGLPVDLADRVRGDTEEAMLKDAETVLTLLKADSKAERPAPRAGGDRGGDPAGDSSAFMGSLIRGSVRR